MMPTTTSDTHTYTSSLSDMAATTDSSASISASSTSESGQCSPASSRSKSPMVLFDLALDPSDPLSYLMGSVSAESVSGGDSSTEESYLTTATPPSTHDSPQADWLDSISQNSNSASTSDSNNLNLNLNLNLSSSLKDILAQHQDHVVNWDPEFATALNFASYINPAMGLTGQLDPMALRAPFQFDPSVFTNDSATSIGNSSIDSVSTADISSILLPFMQSSENNNSGGLHIPEQSTTERRLSVTSSASASSSSASLSPVVEHQSEVISNASNSTLVNPIVLPEGQPQLSGDKLIDELAQRARQIVGVTMALSLDIDGENGQIQGPKLPIPRLQRPGPTPSTQSNANNKRKSSTTGTSASSSPQPTSPSDAAAALVAGIVSQQLPAAPTRTKTSHTTIERRYRTNLNARIQSLRAAVPALRVLEQKAGNRVGNLALKAGTRRIGTNLDGSSGFRAEGEGEDVVDERGYVDGVKVARKGSKANVLGKAVEYIRVLKRREMRLKREQEGLKTLVRSLVGGPALLKEWEGMWRERFGGAEKDEIEHEDGEADDEDEDEEGEGEDGEDVDEEEGGKKRKRMKADNSNSTSSATTKAKPKKAAPATMSTPSVISPSLTMVSEQFSTNGVQPGKRKRGRPRKVPLPLSPESDMQSFLPAASQSDVKMEVDSNTGFANGVSHQQNDGEQFVQGQEQSQTQPQPQPVQYFLAVFALFSFFNSPATSSSSSWATQGPHGHTHSGSVIPNKVDAEASAAWTEHPKVLGPGFGWRDAVQTVHVIMSFLLLVSIVIPWLPRATRIRFNRLVPRVLSPLFSGSIVTHSQAAKPSDQSDNSDDDSTSVSEEEKSDLYVRSLFHSALRRGREMPTAAEEIEVLREALGLGTGILGLCTSMVHLLPASEKSRSRYGLERRMLEQKVVMRMAELVALDARSSFIIRVQTYLYASKFLSIYSASIADLATLALVVRPIWHSKALSLWSLALSRAQGKFTLSSHICRAYEKYILHSMSVDAAAEMVEKTDLERVRMEARKIKHASSDSEYLADSDDEEVGEESTGPLIVLANRVVRDYICTHAEYTFLQTVSSDVIDADSSNHYPFLDIHDHSPDPEHAELEMREKVAAGRSLNAQTAELVNLFEQVCNPTSAHFGNHDRIEVMDLEEEEAIDEEGDNEDSKIRAMLHAIMLYRRIYPSTLMNVPSFSRDMVGTGNVNYNNRGPIPNSSIPPTTSISISLTPMPSPPPSPLRKNVALHLSLRRRLNSPAFDRSDELEDARDHVVDKLTAEATKWSSGFSRRVEY